MKSKSLSSVSVVSRIGLLLPLFVAAVLVTFGGGLRAEVHSSARSVAMGGAYTALAKGAEASRFNPANLGLTN